MTDFDHSYINMEATGNHPYICRVPMDFAKSFQLLSHNSLSIFKVNWSSFQIHVTNFKPHFTFANIHKK